MATGFDPDDVQFHQLCDKFDDELDLIECAIRTGDARLKVDWKLIDGKCVAYFTLSGRFVAELGECELRIEEEVQKSLARLPENARRAAKSRNDLA